MLFKKLVSRTIFSVRCVSTRSLTVLSGAALLVFAFSQSTFAAPVEVIYPAQETQADVRYADLIELLHGALEHTVAEYGSYSMHPADQAMTESRQLAYIKGGNELTVVWSSTSDEKERDLLPIRIPLRKGLLGYRIALIAIDEQNRIDKVKTADDLRELTIGQGLGWGDVSLYSDNGFKLETAPYNDLFSMVAHQRFDLFPRGIGEVFKEYAARSASVSGLAIEKHLLIYYPWPYYFFVNKDNHELAARIEKGLKAMIKDGSFDAVFKKYNADDIARADVRNRRVIELRNLLLPKDTPLGDKSLWFDPTTGR